MSYPRTSTGMICSLFGKTRQAYYQRQVYRCHEVLREDIVVGMVVRYRSEMGRMGGRKLWHELNRTLPGGIGRDRLFDILERHRLKVKNRRRSVRTTWSGSWHHRYPDLAKGLVLTAANQLWVSDITYIRLSDGFAYLHLVSDAYSKKIMGWCLSPTLHARHTIHALRMAIRSAGCGLAGLIHHSDRGCQYCCEQYVKILQDHHIAISMTQDGNPRDNAVAERINGILKCEWLNDEHMTHLDEAGKRVAEVIRLYNNRRPHLSLDYKTPSQAYKETGIQKRVWKNYYKADRAEKEALFTQS